MTIYVTAHGVSRWGEEFLPGTALMKLAEDLMFYGGDYAKLCVIPDSYETFELCKKAYPQYADKMVILTDDIVTPDNVFVFTHMDVSDYLNKFVEDDEKFELCSAKAFYELCKRMNERGVEHSLLINKRNPREIYSMLRDINSTYQSREMHNEILDWLQNCYAIYTHDEAGAAVLEQLGFEQGAYQGGPLLGVHLGRGSCDNIPSAPSGCADEGWIISAFRPSRLKGACNWLNNAIHRKPKTRQRMLLVTNWKDSPYLVEQIEHAVEKYPDRFVLIDELNPNMKPRSDGKATIVNARFASFSSRAGLPLANTSRMLVTTNYTAVKDYSGGAIIEYAMLDALELGIPLYVSRSSINSAAKVGNFKATRRLKMLNRIFNEYGSEAARKQMRVLQSAQGNVAMKRIAAAAKRLNYNLEHGSIAK